MDSMNTPRPKADYHCPQKDLYIIVKLGWTSYAEFLPDFVAFKTTYDAQLGIDQLAALEAARLLPDETTREDIHKSLRIEMEPMGLECLELWSDMSSYIRDAFPVDQYETKRLAAGWDCYAAAQGEDWEAMSELMSKGVKFVNDHTAVLTTPGGMPATFLQRMTDAAAAFDVKLILFLNAEETAQIQTDAKNAANNALYHTMMDMFEDAKKVFRKQPSVRNQFVFETLRDLVGTTTGGGTSTGMKFYGLVTDSSGNPIVGATVSASNSEGSESTTTGVGGLYSLPIAGITEPTSATLRAEFLEMGAVSRPVTIVAGVNQVQNFQLFPEPTPPTP